MHIQPRTAVSGKSAGPLALASAVLVLAGLACNGSAAPTSVPPTAVQVLTPVVVTDTPAPIPSATATPLPSATPTTILIPASVTPQPAGTPQGPCANDYLPVKAGASWTYSGSAVGPNSTKDWTQVDTVSSVGVSDFKRTLAFPDKTLEEQWTCNTDGLLSWSPDGGLFSVIGQGPNGQVTVETTAASGVTLPVHISLGDVWQERAVLQVTGNSASYTAELMYQARAVVDEQVTVPAGTFNALRLAVHAELLIHANGLPPSIFDGTQWMAPGVGLVKRSGTLDSGPGTPSLAIDFELTSYSIPK